nr:MAG TPA: hypothetical protein [Ackermannviridae sp.]
MKLLIYLYSIIFLRKWLSNGIELKMLCEPSILEINHFLFLLPQHYYLTFSLLLSHLMMFVCHLFFYKSKILQYQQNSK